MALEQSENEFSLKRVVKERLMEDMIRAVKPKNGLKVLVLDSRSMRVISAACRMYDIMEEGVTLVEKIDVARQPLPSLEAIYFLSPTRESVDALIKDFENKKEPQYAAVHLFFTSRIDDDELARIKQKHVVTRIKALNELNLDFIAYESQVFHFDTPESFRLLYSPETSEGMAEKHRIAEMIVSACATLKEYPIIRYNSVSKELGGNGVPGAIASLVQDKLDYLMKASDDFSGSVNLGSNRATLIVVDRSFDALAPLLHEFTYQAMVYDLLPIENDHYKYQGTTNVGQSKQKEVILGEHDPLWSTLRHMHIAETMTWILEKFNAFVKENKATKLTTGKKVESLKEMGEAMKAMPQYQEMLDKYSLHIHMANQAMDIFNFHDLTDIASVEQDMATGEDAEGRPAKNILSNMPNLLTHPEISTTDKIRLLMLYIISQEGIKDSDRKRLIDLAKLSNADATCISNLKYLGVTLSKANKGPKKHKSGKDKKKKARDDAPSYELSRYIPSAKIILQDFLENNLSASEFPYVKDKEGSDNNNNKQATPGSTSLRKANQPRWADKDKRKNEKSSTGGRVILFIAGGATYSEMRSVYELSSKFNREVILGGFVLSSGLTFEGSTSVMTPTQYVESLKKLKKVEVVEEDD